MLKTVLLLGRMGVVVDTVQRQLDLPDLRFIGGTGIDDVRSAFAQGKVDHVLMGAGIDLDARLQIVREVFELSETTTVHMKDRDSGPGSFMPFVRAMLGGLRDYESSSSD